MSSNDCPGDGTYRDCGGCRKCSREPEGYILNPVPESQTEEPISEEPPMDDWRITIGYMGNPRTPRQCEYCRNDCEGFLCASCSRRENDEFRNREV